MVLSPLEDSSVDPQAARWRWQGPQPTGHRGNESPLVRSQVDRGANVVPKLCGSLAERGQLTEKYDYGLKFLPK